MELEDIRATIALGVAQADRGEFCDGDMVFEEMRNLSAEVRRERKE